MKGMIKEDLIGIPRNRGTCEKYPGNKGTWPKSKMNKVTSTCSGMRGVFSLEHFSQITVSYLVEFQNES